MTNEWCPQVFYNHHQTAPFPARIWIPPFAEPVSSNVHPLMWRWVNLFGTAMAAYLDDRGMPGAIHRGTGFDDWYPGFIDNVNSFRNTISFLTETALYRYATPHFYTVDEFPRDRQDLRSEVFYSSPWKGGWWRLADAVRYMIGASMSVLNTAAKFKTDLLYNRYQAGRDVINRFKQEPPYAYLIPQDQRDPQTAAILVDKLRINGLEIHQAIRPFTANGAQYKAGTWVVLMDQPFAALAKELLEAQKYPDLRESPNGPPDLPYDVAGWTLPFQMGVEAVAVLSPLSNEARASFEKIDRIVLPALSVQGSGSIYIFSHQTNASIRAINRILAAGGQVSWTRKEITVGQQNFEPGAIVASGIDRQKMQAIADELYLQVIATNQPMGQTISIKKLRIGLYRPWVPSIDEGWTRWLLQQFDFSPTNIYNAEMQAGRLKERFDVIIIPDISGQTIMEGYKPGVIPAEFAGGIGEIGLDNLRAFVKEGGTLVTFDSACLFAIEKFNLPVTNVLAGLKNDQFFCSGSILKAELKDPAHPIAMGLPSEFGLFFDRSPAFETKPSFKGAVLVTYPKEINPLMSGYILHPERIQGKAAALDAAYGKGRIILLGFRPQWRGQSHGTYKFVFNSLYYTGALAGETSSDRQSLQSLRSEDWQNLTAKIKADLGKIYDQDKAFRGAQGAQAVQEGKKLDDLIAQFQKDHLAAIDELKQGIEGTPNARTAQRKLDEYKNQLKALLVDIRSKDHTVVKYTLNELLEQYRLASLEQEISSAIRG